MPRRFLLALAISTCLANEAMAGMLTHADVPAGFEGLVDGQVEQLEIRIAGTSLGVHPVLVRPDSLHFDDAARLAQRLADTGITAPLDALRLALDAPLPANRHLACGTAGSASGCGHVATDSVAVIFDASKGVVSLFANPAWLPNAAARRSRWVAPTPAANALVHRHGFNYSGNADYRAFSANGIGALGIGSRGHFGFEWQYALNHRVGVSEARFAFDDAYYRHDLDHSHYVQAGRMDMHGLASPLGGSFQLALLPLGRMDGVRTGTTLAWLDAGQTGQGTPVSVVLSQRARVDAFRGAQLLSSTYLDAGLQAIDTRAFPVGSYPVTLRIIENGRVTRSETVAFSRTGGEDLGSDQWQWFMQTGRIVDAPDGARGQDVVQAGVRLPALGSARVGNATTVFASRRAYNETRVDWHAATRLGAWSASVGALVGSDGTRGDLEQLTLGRNVALSLYRQALRAKDCRTLDAWPAPRGCHASLTSTVSMPLAGGALTAGYTFSGSDRLDVLASGDTDFDRLRNKGFDAAFARAVAVQGGTLSLRVGAYRREAGGLVDTGMHANVSFSRHRQAASGARPSVHQSASLDALAVRDGEDSARWQAAQTLRWEGSARREFTVLAAADTRSAWEAGLDGRLDGRHGTVGATASHYGSDAGAATAWSAFHTGALAISRDGLFLGAGAPGGEPGAGVIVRVDDAARRHPAGSIAAKVAGASGGDVQLGFGDAMLLPMAGYTPSRTRVADGDGARHSLGTIVSGGGGRDWFLQPGRLGVHTVQATLSMTYVGRLVDGRAQPLSHVLLLESPTAQTGADGSFIAEFDGHPSRIFALDPLQLHVCELGAPDAAAAVQRLGTTRCRVGSVEELPTALRDGERFKRWALRRVANLQSHLEQEAP